VHMKNAFAKRLGRAKLVLLDGAWFKTGHMCGAVLAGLGAWIAIMQVTADV